MYRKTNLLKLLLFSVLVTIVGAPAFSQSRGFIIVGDSTYKEGYISFKENKPTEVFFQEDKKSQLVYYTSEQLSGVGHENGNSYKALEVPYKGKTQRIFVRELAKGNLNLYYLRTKGTVYLLKNKELIELDKSNYKQQLESYMRYCPGIWWQFRRVQFSIASLTALGKSINSGACTSLPARSSGIATALNASDLTLSAESFPDNHIGRFSMPSQNLSAGIYIERLMWGKGNLNYIGQATYQKMSFGQVASNTNYDHQVKADLAVMRFSLQPKYYKHISDVSIFAEIGPEVLYILQQSSSIVQSFRKPTPTTTEVQLAYRNNILDLPTLNFGIIAGGGIKYYYSDRHYLSVSLSTSRTFGKNHSFKNLAATFRVNL